MSAALRADAATLLASVLARRASLAERVAPQRAGYSGRDGALLQEMVFGCLRFLPRLQWCLDRMLDRPLPRREATVRALLLLGLYQLEYLRVPPHAAVSETVGAARRLKRPPAPGQRKSGPG
jgi:16S rRNA (cytosine967-C5)-methyltransferase